MFPNKGQLLGPIYLGAIASIDVWKTFIFLSFLWLFVSDLQKFWIVLTCDILGIGLFVNHYVINYPNANPS